MFFNKFYIVIFFSSLCFGQVDLSYYLDQDHPYNDNIPKPKEILGFEVGEWHVSHDKLVGYMYRIAEASNRITIKKKGVTYEGRPLLILTVTSAENHKNLKSIQENHIKLSESDSDNINLKDQPLIVYQGFSIHGNEPSGANAGLLAIYHLAASEDPETIKMLSDLVILFDPSFNPDGLQRFAYWTNTNKNKNLNPDPNDREYNEVWPRGRTNHYWFDLNRDWLPGEQPESKARLSTFIEWLPNILTDHHEMGTNSSFFFQPGIPARVNPLTPLMNQKITKKIGVFHEEAFNKIGSLYYSEEDYDDFYYGKGSTYPDVNGGIGILFEQASSRGHIQESDNGVLTFPFTIRNQLTAAFSTLKAAVNLRIEILNYFRNFYKSSRVESKKYNKKAIVFGNPKDPSTTFLLAETLKRHDIKVHKLKNTIVKNNKNYSENNSYIIPLSQKKHKLIRAMFEAQTKFKDSLFYDVSGWTFPYAYNLNYDFESNDLNIGEELNIINPPNGIVTKKAHYAYLFEAHNYYTPKLINLLHEKNIRVKVGVKRFIIKGKEYDYGTYLIPVHNQSLNSEDLYEFLIKASKLTSTNIDGLDTGLAEGIDLGSRKFTSVKKTKIALLVGDGISSYDAGEIWHLLDVRHDIRVTKLDIRNFKKIDLANYTHFIIPNFSGSGLDNYVNKIKEFVTKGGSLIAYRNTLKWLDKNDFIKLDFLSKEINANKITFEEKNNFKGAQAIGGAIFNTKIDRSHPINFGIHNSNLPMFRNTSIILKADKESYNNPIQYTSNPLLSGYISKEKLNLLKNSVPFKVSSMGEGKIIILTDNTNFRAFWFGTNKILTNALYLSDKM
jgi:hypothetical protein